MNLFRKRVKRIFVGVLVIMTCFSQVGPEFWYYQVKTAFETESESNIVDKLYHARKNKNVVDNFRQSSGHVAYAAQDPQNLEYVVDLGPISGSTSANYVYGSFFNPSGSGRTVSIKKIAVRSNALAAANWVNLTVRRTTTATAGVLIPSTELPKKNTDSLNSILDVRHTGVTVTLSGSTDSRIIAQAMAGAAGDITSVRDITFSESDEKLILQPGEGIALYQEAAGDVDQRVRIYVEWEELASTPTAENGFLFAFPRVEIAATANYVYNSFFNPGGSGKSAIIKRVWFGTENCDTTAVYTNNIVLRRTTAASAGTQITSSTVPKKNTSGANSVMEFRRTGVTVTAAGTEARIGHVTPCAAASQSHGWQKIDFQDGDEKFILQPGEGIALISDTAGDIDQLVRMIVEWQEVTTGNTPASAGEYVWASNRVAVAAALNTSFYTFFNPGANSKTMVVKRIGIRTNAIGTATYSSFQLRRITAASAGTLIAAADLPKKHSGTANATVEVRWCGAACGTAITTTYAGTTDSDLLQVTGAGAVAQISGQKEIIFGANEKLVLKPGEGIGLYIDDLAGSANQYVKMYIEWDEETSAPSALNEYLLDVGSVPGSTATSYNYVTFFNPAASGKTAIIKRLNMRVDTIAAAVYRPIQVRRITAASAGTLIAAANIPKKNTSTANSIVEIRRTGVTATYAGGSDSELLSATTPGAIGTAIAPATGAYRDVGFANQEFIILQPGEGIGMYHDGGAGDADLRIKLLVEWEEVTYAGTPASIGDFMVTTGPTTLNASTTSNYVYATLFNPISSTKDYIVKRLGIQSNRIGTLVAPGNSPISLRRVDDAWAGTLQSTSNIPKKHASTTAPTAEVRYANPQILLALGSSSKILGVNSPGAVNYISGIYETEIVPGDELVLRPGEGVALYQETQAADLLVNYFAFFEWMEAVFRGAAYVTQVGYRFFTNADSASVGASLAAQDTPVTLGAAGASFRLRLALRTATSSLQYGQGVYRLQYVEKGAGTCAAPSGSSPSVYTDITDTTSIAMKDNPSVLTMVPMTATTTDPTDGGNTMVAQSYHETNLFSNSQAAIFADQTGKWDFSLYDNGAPQSSTFCFRSVKSASPMYYSGNNIFDQGAIGASSTAITSLTKIGISEDWIDVTPTFSGATYALRGDGTIWAWGSNSLGQLGQNHQINPRYQVVQVGTSTDWVSLATRGTNSAMAIKADGTLWGWGDNFFNQIGIATSTTGFYALRPYQVGVATDWAAISSSFSHSMGIKTDGTLWAMGLNDQGQLGLGTATSTLPITAPTQVGSDTWIDVSVGSQSTLGIKTDGTLWVWGKNDNGQFGTGASSTAQYLSPVQIGTDADWKKVSHGSTAAFAAIKTDGTIWAWGNNTNAQIGQGVANGNIYPLSQVGVAEWKDVSMGTTFAVAQKTNGTVWMWGSNSSGQAADGTTTGPKTTPTQIGSSNTWRKVLGGASGVYLLDDIQTPLDSYGSYPEITIPGGQSISFSLSTTTAYFGQLSASGSRYASSTNVSGSGTEVEAHTFTVTTSASSGYTVSVRGQTLTSLQNGAHTVTAIGGTNTTPAIGSEQFGLRATATGGLGTVASPYAASGFAYTATATTSAVVGQAASGNGVPTVFSVRYLSNISATTEAGTYSSNLTYTVTANY